MFEEIENKKKHSVAFTVLGAFILLVTMAGVAVAAYTWSYAGQTANTIGTGNISMSLLESTDVIYIENALPISDSSGKIISPDDAFDFAVTTQASGAPGNIVYNLNITKVAVDDDATALPDSGVKVYLTVVDDEGEETQVMAPTAVSQIVSEGQTTGTLTFDTGKETYLTHIHTSTGVSKTTKYRLRMWIDQSVNASNWDENTKNQFRLKVGTSGNLVA